MVEAPELEDDILEDPMSFIENFDLADKLMSTLDDMGFNDALKLLKSDLLGGQTLVLGEFENNQNITPEKLGKRIIGVVKDIFKMNPLDIFEDGILRDD